MPSSAIIIGCYSAVHEIFADGTINEDSPTPCNKMTPKTVRSIPNVYLQIYTAMAT